MKYLYSCQTVENATTSYQKRQRGKESTTLQRNQYFAKNDTKTIKKGKSGVIALERTERTRTSS